VAEAAPIVQLGLSASAVSVALRVLAEHGLAERGPGGWRRGPVALADVAESTGTADLQREREALYRGAGNDGPVSTAEASSFLNCPGGAVAGVDLQRNRNAR